LPLRGGEGAREEGNENIGYQTVSALKIQTANVASGVIVQGKRLRRKVARLGETGKKWRKKVSADFAHSGRWRDKGGKRRFCKEPDRKIGLSEGIKMPDIRSLGLARKKGEGQERGRKVNVRNQSCHKRGHRIYSEIVSHTEKIVSNSALKEVRR